VITLIMHHVVGDMLSPSGGLIYVASLNRVMLCCMQAASGWRRCARPARTASAASMFSLAMLAIGVMRWFIHVASLNRVMYAACMQQVAGVDAHGQCCFNVQSCFACIGALFPRVRWPFCGLSQLAGMELLAPQSG